MDNNILAKEKIEARAFILHAVNKTQLLELKDEENTFSEVSPKQLITHLQTICGGLHTIDIMALQNEIQEYHVDSNGILKYINALEAAKKNQSKEQGEIPSQTRPFCSLQRTQC